MAQAGTLHFLCGKAGSGKTTLAREIAQSSGGIVFVEDEWLSKLAGHITSLEDYVTWSRRLRSVIGPLAVQLLQRGVPVVLDFAGNTVASRAWVRSLFEAAGAAHVLHVLTASDELCKARILQRNAAKPEGLYYGDVSLELFDAVTRHFVPPSAEEGFTVVGYDAHAR